MNQHHEFQPVLLRDVEITRQPRAIEPPIAPTGFLYDRARLLIRNKGWPVGEIDVDLPSVGLDADAIRRLLAPFSLHEPPGAHASPKDPLPRISVVLATRHRPDKLRRCLSSLAASTHLPAEVIVVENTSEPAEARQVVASTGKELNAVYVWEPRPGLATAHNAGVQHATSPLIAFTDDDVEVDTQWLAEIARAFVVHPSAGAVTGLIYPMRLDHPAQMEMERIGFNKGFDERVFDLGTDAGPMWPLTVGACGSGANMAFRRQALDAIGGFDELLGAGTPCRGGDDLAAFFEVIDAGWKIAYSPAAIVRHDHDTEQADLRRRAFSYGCGLGAFLGHVAVRRPGLLLATALRQIKAIFARNRVELLSHGPGYSNTRWAAGLGLGFVMYLQHWLRHSKLRRPAPLNEKAVAS